MHFTTPKPSKAIKFCAVCGRAAISRHFGALSCKACAAFFRRTVTGRKSFTCEKQRNCVIDSRPYQLICQACRWQKCISAGMQVSEVVSLGAPRKPRRRNTEKKQQLQMQAAPVNNTKKKPIQQSSVAVSAYRSPSMPKLQKFDHNSTFSSYQNHEWLRKLNFVNQALQYARRAMLPAAMDPFNKKSIMPDITNYLLNDSRFCHTYLVETGIFNIASEVIDKKLPEIILHWSYLTTLLNTLQYDCLQHRKITCMDYSMIEMSEASLREWYATEPMFSRHYDILVGFSWNTDMVPDRRNNEKDSISGHDKRRTSMFRDSLLD
uniref:Nuclear receptor domain-containing protein n=1 Tax=Panagrellus redivivus TaxID=6233 RepID=A0A7E4W6L2_PANRE